MSTQNKDAPATAVAEVVAVVETAKPKRVAVVFAAEGGFGDVGKLAAVAAIRDARLGTPVLICLTHAGDAGGSTEVRVDDAALRDDATKALSDAEVLSIDIEAADAQARVASAIEGCDAVVACIGNRQGLSYCCATSAEKLVQAMTSKDVEKLVLLTSYGLGTHRGDGNDTKKMWWGMTMKKEVKADLVAMEKVVTASTLSYLLVRAVQLDPAAPPGNLKAVRTRRDGSVRMKVAKSDVARFMVDEALELQSDAAMGTGAAQRGPRKTKGVVVGAKPGCYERVLSCCGECIFLAVT